MEEKKENSNVSQVMCDAVEMMMSCLKKGISVFASFSSCS